MEYACQYRDGRIYLPKSLREEFGDEFELIDRGDRLVLVPVPEDLLEALRKEAGKSDKSAEQLKESALDEALEEAGRRRTLRPTSCSR
ncbi:AbrB/MazE/SpoVT family DNA-binding domain-containing protein [Natrinema salaciae]|uniref:Looped-hinge helix DNA binding domain-containing protein, AbrB family n=1 Tax=Natrinema salaciae TaxID=1186196 RepID=A0A1H9C563_9EURY|nr:AbrB/MazE/SpoVT family DNA-binding domain-containing protein [Natrinema salaciae]SEP96299.1 hypothetical protein SAMN04489841_0956 [Natrinema salaciae]